MREISDPEANSMRKRLTLLPLGTLYTEPTKVTAFNGVLQASARASTC
jgi:hypothetical protein